MNIDELDKKIQDFMNEMRQSHNAIASNQLSLAKRLDTLDLNGAATYLRDFGYFLKDHPDFMKREAESETKRVREEIAKAWLIESLHLTNFGSKLRWVITALLMGALLAFGSTLAGMASEASSLFHAAGHALFK